MLQILNFSELQAKGLKVAKIKANRDLDEKNVKAKMADLKSRGAPDIRAGECRLVMQPISYGFRDSRFFE